MTDVLRLPAAEEPAASILIPAFHAPTFGACLRSLAEHLPLDEPACEVIALLNGPSDQLRAATKGIEGLREIDTPANLGFPAGLNALRRVARGRYLVLFQDDAQIEPGWLEALVATVEAHPEAGAVGGTVLDDRGEVIQSAGVVLFCDGVQHALDAGLPADRAGSLGLRAVDYSSSSSLLVRAATWDAIGGAGEDFFPAGHVDADLALRIRRHGQIVLNEPAARSRHVQGASRSAGYKRFTGVRNALLFRERWGEELAETQEPPGDRGVAAVRRALALAQERWRDTATSPPAPAAEPPASVSSLEPEQALTRALEASERHLALRVEYEAELEPSLEHFEAETVALRDETARLRAELERSERVREAILTGRWWRLRERLRRVWR